MVINYIEEPLKKIPNIGVYDIVVCGGGPSGIMAALAAARKDQTVLIVEKYGFFGGMATAGLVGPISKFNLNNERIVTGIPEEFINNMHAMNGAIIDLPSGNIPYDAEIYKYVAQEMLIEAGVNILLHTSTVDVVIAEDNQTISHVIIENKSGRQAVQAKYFIDCTGTGDVLWKSNCDWSWRKNEKGDLQPMSLFFRLGGVDTSALQLLMSHDGGKYRSVELREVLTKELEKGVIDNFGGPWVVHGSTIREGEVSVNATRFKGNAAIGGELSNAELKLRSDVYKIIKVFKDYSPAFQNAYLIDTAVQVGIRETRSTEGLYKMEVDDILMPKDFPDTIAKGGHPIDIHRSNDSKQDVNFITKPYNIPYRAIVPKNSTNLLVAGSTISATRQAFASIRVQAQCMAIGQAAGTAAALCNDNEIQVASLEGSLLRTQLKNDGALV